LKIHTAPMTLYEFNAMDEMEQAEAVWDGVYIADREDIEHRILLYQLDNFYVEVFYFSLGAYASRLSIQW